MNLRLGVVGEEPLLEPAKVKSKLGAIYVIMEGRYDDVEQRYGSPNSDHITVITPMENPEPKSAFRLP